MFFHISDFLWDWIIFHFSIFILAKVYSYFWYLLIRIDFPVIKFWIQQTPFSFWFLKNYEFEYLLMDSNTFFMTQHIHILDLFLLKHSEMCINLAMILVSSYRWFSNFKYIVKFHSFHIYVQFLLFRAEIFLSWKCLKWTKMSLLTASGVIFKFSYYAYVKRKVWKLLCKNVMWFFTLNTATRCCINQWWCPILVISPVRRRSSRGRGSPARTARICVSVPLISLISSISLILFITSVIMSWRRSPIVILVPLLIVPIAFMTVFVLIVSITLPVSWIPMVIIITLISPWGASIIVSVILIITSLIIRGRPSIVILVSFIIITITFVTVTRISSSSSSTTITQTEARPSCFSVMEVNTRSWFMGSFCDREINPNFKTGYFCSIQIVSCLFGIISWLEVNEGKSPGSLGRSIQNDLDTLNVSIPSKFSFQITLRGCEI